MLDSLKQEVLSAITYLKEQKMRFLGKGNISFFDRANSLIVAEPSTDYPSSTPGDMLVLDLSGQVVEGTGAPTIDLPTHIELYRAFSNISCIIHSHGIYTSAWAQSGRDIPVYGTAHLDYFGEAIPCTRPLSATEAEEYEISSGQCIAEIFQKKSLSPEVTSASLLFQHGAYIWGQTPMETANRCIALEQISMLAYLTEKINPEITGVPRNVTGHNQ